MALSQHKLFVQPAVSLISHVHAVPLRPAAVPTVPPAPSAFVPPIIKHNSGPLGSIPLQLQQEQPQPSIPIRKHRRSVTTPIVPQQHQQQGPLPLSTVDLGTASKSSLMKWKVVDLRHVLTDLQLPISGLKPDLVERLHKAIKLASPGGDQPAKSRGKEPQSKSSKGRRLGTPGVPDAAATADPSKKSSSSSSSNSETITYSIGKPSSRKGITKGATLDALQPDNSSSSSSSQGKRERLPRRPGPGRAAAADCDRAGEDASKQSSKEPRGRKAAPAQGSKVPSLSSGKGQPSNDTIEASNRESSRKGRGGSEKGDSSSESTSRVNTSSISNTSINRSSSSSSSGTSSSSSSSNERVRPRSVSKRLTVTDQGMGCGGRQPATQPQATIPAAMQQGFDERSRKPEGGHPGGAVPRILQELRPLKQAAVEGEHVPLADDSFLPPMPVASARRQSYGLHESDLPPKRLEAFLLGNPTDMQLAFLGTAAFKPHRGRALGSVALLRGKDVWIFDAGDDLQRQLGSLPFVRPSKVFRIFITRNTTDCLLGLPGLLCTINAARKRGHASSDIPVHIYGPLGIAEFLCTVFKVSNTYQEVNLVVHEFVPYAVSEEKRSPKLINQRARVFRALEPPDVLNPQGVINGNLDAFMPTLGRATVAKGNGASGGVLAYDPRAGFLPFPPLAPGDPARQREGLPLESLAWTVQADISAQFTVVTLPSTLPSQQQSPHQGSQLESQLTLACIIKEADRMGNLLVDRALALGLEPGPDFTRLKDGFLVKNKDGLGVTSDMCVTPPKPGRRLVIMGTTPSMPAPSSAFVQHAQGADVLITGAVAPPSSSTAGSLPDLLLSSGGGPSCGLSPADYGKLAARLGVDRLLLARLDMRQLQQVLQLGAASYQQASGQSILDNGEHKAKGWSNQALEAAEAAYVEQLRQEASDSVASCGAECKVSVPFDFMVHVLEKHG